MPIYPYSFQLPPLNVQDIPNDGVPGEFLGISAGGQLDWLPAGGGGGSGDMLAANNLSELTNFATARTNIGLGTASTPTFANLTLTSPSLSSSAPVTISQTWNQIGTAFTAFKVNAVSTASASSSLLADFQLGTVSKLKVDKNGGLISSSGSLSGLFLSSGTDGMEVVGGALFAFSSSNIVATINRSAVKGFSTTWDGAFAFGTSNTNANVSGADTILLRDAANTLALRNGTSAQTFNVYGTYSSAASYARLAIACDTSGNATLTTQSTGVAGTVSINGVPVGLGKDNVSTNIAIGLNALSLQSIAESTRNIGIGNNSLRYTSISCVAIGIDALQNGTGGTISGNVAVGDSALFASTNPGSRNTGIGFWAMRGNNSFDSTGLGWAVLLSTSATNTCALGAQAGRYITGGATNNSVAANSIYIGNDTKAAASGETNQIVIGYNATGIGSHSVVLGNDSIEKTALKGNVGIGTTAPTATLHVNGGELDQDTKRVALFQSNDVNIQNNFSVVGITSSDATVNTFQHRLLDLDYTTATASTGTYIRMLRGGNEKAGIALANDEFVITGEAVERLRISAAGNVGIGTTSPTSKLHVAGNILVEGATFGSGAGTLTYVNSTVGGFWTSSGRTYGIRSGEGFIIGDSLLSLSSTNNSGIPDVKLNAPSAHTLELRNGTNGQTFSVYGTYPGAAWERFTITAPTSGNVLLGTYKGTGGIARGLEFQTDGVTRMSVGPTGNIGIGTPASSSKLEVSGSVDVTLLRTGFYVQANTQFMFGSGGTGDVAMQRNEAGVMEINSTTAGTFRDLRVRSVIQQPPATITPATNGDLVVEATSNTTLTFKLKGTDGTVRSGTITLA